MAQHVRVDRERQFGLYWEAHGEAGIYDRVGTHQVRRAVGWPQKARIRAAVNDPGRTKGRAQESSLASEHVQAPFRHKRGRRERHRARFRS